MQGISEDDVNEFCTQCVSDLRGYFNDCGTESDVSLLDASKSRKLATIINK